jgi:AraC-like DNA-binding protein/tetratricopeptide (TPR) repeat protein
MRGRRQARAHLSPDDPPSSGTLARGPQRKCVQRALATVKAALARDAACAPSLSDLAAAVGVSRRTLQRQFALTLRQSPRCVVQRLRLAAARETLHAGSASSVLDAALRHGFEHPGRFAAAYARAFGEVPSVTLSRARHARLPPVMPPAATPVVLRALMPATPLEAGRARRATDELVMALCRAPGLSLAVSEPVASARADGALRLEGRVEAEYAVLSFVRPATGLVLGTVREPFGRRGGLAWADRAVGALRAAIAREEAVRAQRRPARLLDVEALVARARPAALSQEPELVAMALDLLGEALLREPLHPRALALVAWSRALGANHSFTRHPEHERDSALTQCRQALALASDDAEVLTLGAGTLSLTRNLDAAEGLVARSLDLDPCQPEALRRMGFIHNFRGDGRRGAMAFRRALTLYPGGNDGAMSLIGLGVANFIVADYARAARSLARALEQQPARAWPHRFLAAAAMHLGAHEEGRRSVLALRRAFPELTLDLCDRSGALHPEAKNRMLHGLARAGLPR